MKIKEVYRITGLTEKTIRFYEEKQLINPNKVMNNGRIFRSYTIQDIETLKLVAELRKLDFSISDILIMRDEPMRIPEIIKQYEEKTSEDLSFKIKVIERLKQTDYGSISSIHDIAGYLKDTVVDRPLPAADMEFHFYKTDGLTREELDNMTDFIQRLYFDSRNEEMGDNRNLGLYVHETCHNFIDPLGTRMHDMLIWSYDVIFQELLHNKAIQGKKGQLEQLFEVINDELMELSREIVFISESERAELIRRDNKESEVLRSRIDELVDKYIKETEEILQRKLLPR